MEERVILHSDINHCYAQIEEMKYPELREIPMAVGGHEEARHGIILAKNDLAKTYDIKTGESLREAYQKCPELMIIHPNYEEYIYYTEKVKDIYREYSDRVESFGLDEAWIDVSDVSSLFGSGYQIASQIQQRVQKEIGLTISIGVSFNKIFAKIGSDMIKPSGLVEITKENYRDLVWNLPIGDMFYVGRATKRKLEGYGIMTIKDMAELPLGWMRDHFGKMGELIWWFAHGEDISQVALKGERQPIKSVGNGITTPKDICTFEEAKIVFYVLVESVASRLKENGLCGSVVSIALRNKNLESFTRQQTLTQATDLGSEIMAVVMKLVKNNYTFTIPLRSLSVSVSGIRPKGRYQQLDLFVSETKRKKQKDLEETMDAIRDKYGFDKVRRCVTLLDRELSDFNPKEDHIIHPESFF